MSRALWDLKCCPTTFDFAAFLVCAKTLGTDHVHFKYEGEIQSKKYSPSVAWKRFANVLTGLCDLAEVSFSVGHGGDGIVPGYHWGTVEALYKELGTVWKYPLLKKKEKYITITLRNSFRNTWRNADRQAWFEAQRFLAKRFDVIVMDDCELDPISIHTRMSFYSGAVMNFGVSNGPLALCHFSEAPYMVFMKMDDKLAQHMKDTGFPVGSQFGFRNEHQELVWAHDTRDNVMQKIEGWVSATG